MKKLDPKIDYEKIMEYPLSNNPLCLAHPDGSLRKNVKADLKAILLKDIPTVDSSINAHAIVIDLIVLIKTDISILISLLTTTDTHQTLKAMSRQSGGSRKR